MKHLECNYEGIPVGISLWDTAGKYFTILIIKNRSLPKYIRQTIQ